MIIAEPEKPRLINILAELCQCNPADILWDGSGSSDTISFDSDGRKIQLKLSQEPANGRSRSFMDFRVRVVISD